MTKGRPAEQSGLDVKNPDANGDHAPAGGDAGTGGRPQVSETGQRGSSSGSLSSARVRNNCRAQLAELPPTNASRRVRRVGAQELILAKPMPIPNPPGTRGAARPIMPSLSLTPGEELLWN